MGLFNNFLDKFKTKDFHLSPNLLIRTAQKKFSSNFRLTLRVYKGNQFADPDLTFAKLNKKTSAEIKSGQKDLIIKSSFKVGEFETLVKKHYGLKIQIADEFDRYLINDKYTLGQASRREPLLDWCKERGHNSIEDFLKSKNCNSLADYYEKH